MGEMNVVGRGVGRNRGINSNQDEPDIMVPTGTYHGDPEADHYGRPETNGAPRSGDRVTNLESQLAESVQILAQSMQRMEQNIMILADADPLKRKGTHLQVSVSVVRYTFLRLLFFSYFVHLLSAKLVLGCFQNNPE